MKQLSISRPSTNAPVAKPKKPLLQKSPQSAPLPPTPDPQQITPTNIMQLQRTVGNQAVTRLLGQHGGGQLAKPTIQPKLKVGAHNDRYEREADAVAQQVTHTTAQPLVQPTAQRAPQAAARATQPQVGPQGGMVGGEIESTLRSHKSTGSALPNTVRRTLEPQLGRDLSQVRTHTDATAVQLNRQLGAKAFTYGNNIFYGAGHSPRDLKLTAHESTHVVQQSNPAPLAAPETTSEVQRAPAKTSATLGQPRIQRENEKIKFHGKSKTIEKNNKDQFKSTITKLSAKGVEPVPEGTKPRAVLLMGAPGSGKSSILHEVVPDIQNFVHADADQVKEAMPKYQQGIKQGDQDIANKVHNESKEVTKSITKNAITTRRNLLFDGTGGNATEYSEMITKLRQAGYHVTLALTHISVDEGLKRVAERAAKTGRSVPDNVVRSIYHYMPINFPILVRLVDQAYLFDNMVFPGEAPRLIWETQNGQSLTNNQVDYVTQLLGKISAKSMNDVEQVDNDDSDDRAHLPKTAHRRYLQDGGTTRWRKDIGGGPATPKMLKDVDDTLTLYRRYKSKNLGNAEEQGKLLLHLNSMLPQTRYQVFNKNSKTFTHRQQATSMLIEEVKRELKTNPIRLKKTISDADKIKELTTVGFTAQFLGKLLKLDLRLLYEAHAALSHRQHNLAQAALDRLNPVERDDNTKQLQYDTYSYIKRTRKTLHFAQQMLSAYHHANIGGEYGRAFTKPEPMAPERIDKVTNKYIRNPNFIDKNVLKAVKKQGGAEKSLQDLIPDYPALTSQELEAIRIYSNSVYQKMNATMHDIRPADPKEQSGFKGYTSLSQVAVSGLSKLPSYTGAFTYRGDGDFGGVVDTATVGTTFRTPSFMSTSKTLHVAAGFGESVAWVLKVAPNSRGKDITKISTVAGEKEVLFPPGAKMKVVDVFRYDTKSTVIAGETKEARIPRVWKSDLGSPMHPEVYRFLATPSTKARRTVIVLEEVG